MTYMHAISVIKVLFTTLHGRGNRLTIMTLKCDKRKINWNFWNLLHVCEIVYISSRVRLPSFSLGYNLISWKNTRSMSLSAVHADGTILRCHWDDKITAISREKPGEEERFKSLYPTSAPRDKGVGVEAAKTPALWGRSTLHHSSHAKTAAFSRKALSVSFTKSSGPISRSPPSCVWKNIHSLLITTRCWASKTSVKVEITSPQHRYRIFAVVILLPD